MRGTKAQVGVRAFHRHGLPLVALILASTATARAEPLTATTVSDAPGLKSIRIEAPDPGIPICVVVPTRAGDCGDVDTAALATQFKSTVRDANEVVSLVLVRYESHSVAVNVMRLGHPGKDMTDHRISLFIQGMNDAQRGDATRVLQAPGRTRLGEYQAISASYEQKHDDVALLTSTHVVFGEKQLHSITFISPVAEAASKQRVERHVLQSLVYEPGDLGFLGKPHAEYLGYRTAKLGVPVLTLLFLAGFVGWLSWRSRRATRPRPTAPVR